MKELYGVLCLFIMIIFSFFDFSRDIFQMLPVFSVSTSRTPPLAARPTPRQSPRNGEHTPFPADSIGASRLIILHQRPDIRQQPDLNMPDIKIILHTWRHPYKVTSSDFLAMQPRTASATMERKHSCAWSSVSDWIRMSWITRISINACTVIMENGIW